jgi:hypothetical protein
MRCRRSSREEGTSIRRLAPRPMRTAPTEILAALEHAGRDTARVIRPIPNARVGDGFVTGSPWMNPYAARPFVPSP